MPKPYQVSISYDEEEDTERWYAGVWEEATAYPDYGASGKDALEAMTKLAQALADSLYALEGR